MKYRGGFEATSISDVVSVLLGLSLAIGLRKDSWSFSERDKPVIEVCKRRKRAYENLAIEGSF